MAISREWAFRVLGSTLLLGVTFWLLPTDGLLDSLLALDPTLFLAVLGLFLAGQVVLATKWWLLCDRIAGIGLAMRAHFAGLAANLCLPGMSGGDAVRAGIVLSGGGSSGKVVAGSLGDRLVDLLALGLLSAFGLLALSGAGAGSDQLVAQVISILIGLLLLIFIVLPPFLRGLTSLFSSFPGKTLLIRLASALGDLARQPEKLAAALFLSMGVQALFVILIYWLAEGIGAKAPLAAWFFAWPLAKIMAVLPISLGGLGVREASLAALMAPLGILPAGVIAASLIWHAVLVATGLVGVAAWGLTTGEVATSNPKSANGS